MTQGHEGFDLEELLKVEVSSERIERLKEWTKFDDPDMTPEVEEYLHRQFAKLCHIQYGRFLAGVTFTEEEPATSPLHLAQVPHASSSFCDGAA